MPEDMYSDGPEAAPAGPAEGAEPKDDKGDTGQTGLLPKSVLGPDLEPGHVCEVEIVADHGDDYEVKYAKEGEHAEKPESPAAPPAEAGGGGGMESMLND